MRLSAVLVLSIAIAPYAAAAPAERTHDITPEDYATVNLITEVAISPGGKQVGYCQTRWDRKSNRRLVETWVVDTDGKGKPKQLTFDGSDQHLRWSADGKSLYLLRAQKKEDAKKPPYDGKPQVWKVPAAGGEAKPVTEVAGGVVGFDYAPKADAVFYTIDATATDEDEFSALRKKFDTPEYGHGKRTVSELYRIDAGKDARKLIADGRYIREFAVTRDGEKIAMITARDDTVVKSEGESHVDVWHHGKIVTPPTDVYRAKAPSPHAWLESLAWSPDGTRFAFCAVFDGYPAEIVIGAEEKGRWSMKLIPREKTGCQVHGYGSPLHWSKETLWYITEVAANNQLGLYSDDRLQANLLLDRADRVVYTFDVTPTSGDSFVMVAGNGEGLPELILHEQNGRKKLIDPNPHTATWKFPSVEHITWKAPDGATVGGPLELPHGFKKGDRKLPLVVAIHGGPTTASYNDLRFDPHNGRLYFAAKGYAVLCPNYRGSTGYGDRFTTDLIGRENDIEVKDILAGIQHLVREGIVDPDRIAVTGWSNGGYLTNCLITLKNPQVRIGAASSGAGILDTVAEWGFNDEPAYPMVFKKGLPWQTPDVYRQTSPTYGLGNVKTPTLIHVGGGDVRCPPGHSRMLYRALDEYVKVPTELVVYPGEPHGLSRLNHRIAKMEWDLAWFEKYLKAK
jgi:dipeptidyl aminopeptidase/acylaminoacyl peptidase